MLLLSILAFVVIFSFLVLIHEWGHFAAARFFGVKVEEFGLGLPPRAATLGFDRKGTRYSLNWLPLGGFVRMKGEDSLDSAARKTRDSFAAKPVWQRMIIICAGVFVNFVGALVLLTIVFWLGRQVLITPADIPDFQAQQPQAQIISQAPAGLLISQILPDSAAAGTELRAFDLITAIDGQPTDSFESFQAAVQARAGQPVELAVRRRELDLKIVAMPGADGRLGVALAGPFEMLQVQYSLLDAPVQAARETVRMTGQIVAGVGDLAAKLVREQELPADIGGPVAIARETHYRATDPVALLQFAAMLSLTLAVFNILPIPALDGGRFVFLAIEAIIRRRPNPKLETAIHSLGYLAVLALIFAVTWRDIFG